MIKENITIIDKCNMDENLVNDIQNLLTTKKWTMTKIAKSLKINKHRVKKLFTKNNIVYYANRNLKYNLNENYFDIIDSEEKAYILGFIYADGCNHNNSNRVSIYISVRDIDLLLKISHIMFGENAIKHQTRLQPKSKEYLEYISIDMNSKHLSERLIELGVTPNKSKTLKFPEWLDKNLYKHFIRGIIDGDGWIHLPSNNRDSPSVGLISATSFNNSLKEFLEKELSIKSYINKANKQDKNEMYDLVIKNYKQCNVLLHWLYDGATMYLDRKYETYQNFLSLYNNLRDQNK